MLSFGILSEAMKVINIKDCDIVEFDFESFSDELDIKEFLAPRNFPVINEFGRVKLEVRHKPPN
jgi:hypothetical protein